MLKKRTFSLAGAGALGAAALLLSGCGGNSFSKNTFGNYAETLPAVYGLDPIAINPAATGLSTPTGFELSGLGSPDGKTAYLTAATAFTVVQNPGGTASLPVNVNTVTSGAPQLPYGFSTGGVYINAAAGSGVPAAAVLTGTSVTFRAALANGVASNNTPAISTATLTSTDPQWTLGTLPMTFNNVGSGPLANGTYVTGTNGTPTPFTLPFTEGIHSVVVTVTDAAGRATATTFAIPVSAPSSVTLFLQSFTVVTAAVAATSTTPAVPATTSQNPITPGDLVSLDGGTAQTADAQGTVIFFTTPGTHTITEKSADGATTVQTATFSLPLTDAKGVVTGGTPGTTVYGVPADNGTGSGTGSGTGTGGGTGGASGALRGKIAVGGKLVNRR